MHRLEGITSQNTGNHFYTQQQNVLSPEDRQFYEDNGYIIVRGLLDQSEYSKYVERFLEYCEERRPRPPGMAMVKDIALAKSGKKVTGEAAVTKIQDWQDDEVLFEFCKNEKILQVVGDIIGPNIKTCHTMLINKPPNTGPTQRHPLHQDLAYFPFRPSERIVCCWSAMEDVSRENGGLVLFPGTHKMPFVEHGYPKWKEGVNKGYWGILDKYMPDHKSEKVHPVMKAGDCVFFHPHVLHGSGENRTQGFRKSISCHYAASECYYIDVSGTHNEIVAKGVTDFAKKSYKLDIPYNDIWRRKMRLVAGQEFCDGNNNYV